MVVPNEILNGGIEVGLAGGIHDLQFATCMSLVIDSVPGKVGFTSMAITAALGTNSCSNSRRFPSSAALNWLTPVILPPGRLRPATRPSLTGQCHRRRRLEASR